VTLDFAGVAAKRETLVTAGGRVLGATGCGDSLSQARERAYRACSSIHWQGMHNRSDIAQLDAANSGTEVVTADR
jgi:phosphoribosylamine--glycine ligase